MKHIIVCISWTMMLLCFSGVAKSAAQEQEVKEVNISNIELRRDHLGELMDVHDGMILPLVDATTGVVTYLYYGIAYHNCSIQHSWFPPHWCPGIYEPFGQCGFRTDHSVRLYASPDLSNWTLLSKNVFPVEERPYGIYFRPKVIYCSRTRKYVLWLDFLPNASSPLLAYPNAELLVATSDVPEGPFIFLHAAGGLAHSGPGDFTIMKVVASQSSDKNNTNQPVLVGSLEMIHQHAGEDDVYEEAYIAYGAWSTEHTISIEKLDENFTNSLGLKNSSGLLTPSGNEAPILFERLGWYYLVFGECCCFCQQGADSTVYVARHPLGPWSASNGSGSAGDINPLASHMKRNNNKKSEGSGESRVIHHQTEDSFRIISSQNNYVFTIPSSSESVPMYVWMGDRWASALDGLFGHDLQSWHILSFSPINSSSSSAPTIETLSWQEWFLLNVTTSV